VAAAFQAAGEPWLPARWPGGRGSQCGDFLWAHGSRPQWRAGCPQPL